MRRPTSRDAVRVARLAAGLVIVLVLVAVLGTGPVVTGLRSVGLASLLVAVVITAGTTWCCARRWRLVGDRLQRPVDGSTAYASCYRAQLLNATLPGGVVGDVGRGLGHGFGAVLWERALGQATQVALTVVLLLALPSPVGWTAGPVALAGLAVAATVLAGVSATRRRDLVGLADLRSVCAVVLLSVAASAGHLAVFAVAARGAGVTVPLPTLLPTAALVLVAAAIPANVAGWGPREGVAVWALTSAGVAPSTALSVAVAFGVLSLAGTLPGLLTLVPRHRPRATPTAAVLTSRPESVEPVVARRA